MILTIINVRISTTNWRQSLNLVSRVPMKMTTTTTTTTTTTATCRWPARDICACCRHACAYSWHIRASYISMLAVHFHMTDIYWHVCIHVCVCCQHASAMCNTLDIYPRLQSIRLLLKRPTSAITMHHAFPSYQDAFYPARNMPAPAAGPASAVLHRYPWSQWRETSRTVSRHPSRRTRFG